MLNSKFWVNCFKIKKEEIKIRRAKIEDIPQILEVEKLTWGEEKAATKEMFQSRIETFPEGTLVAIVEGKIVGVIASQIIDFKEEEIKNWYEMTDNGFIKRTHNPEGDILYGVDLSVHPDYQNKGVGKKLMEATGRLIIDLNLKRGMLGGRIPNYYKFADKLNVEAYINLVKTSNPAIDIPPEPELLFWKKLGLKINKPIPNYFKDLESANYGVLLIWENPFYNKWYRWIMAKIFRAP